MTLMDYWSVVRRRLWLVGVLVLLGGLAALVFGQPASPSAPTFNGSVLLTLEPGSDPGGVLYYDYVALQTSAVLDSVVASADKEGLYETPLTADQLLQQIRTTPSADIGILRIDIAGQPSRKAAERVLQLYGDEIVAFAAKAKVAERDESLVSLEARIASLELQISTVQKQIDAQPKTTNPASNADPLLQAQLTTLLASHSAAVGQAEELRARSSEQLSPLRFIGAPRVVDNPMAKDPLGPGERLALGLGLGLLIGIVLAIGLHRFDRRIYSRRDAETGFHLPVLAEVPLISYRKRRRFQLIAQQEPSALASEAFRILRSSVDHARSRQLHGEGEQSGSGTVVLVTSVTERVGKSTTVANLAVASVYAGKKVLIVAGDLRQPTIHQFFRVENGPGVADFVDDLWKRPRTVDYSAYVQNTVVPDVSIIHHGREVISAGETVAAAGPLIVAAREHFDVVFIDSPSMMAGSDVNELVGQADLVLLVARVGRSTTDDGELAHETAERLQAPMCGVALVGVRPTARRSLLVRAPRAAFRRLFRRQPPNRQRAVSGPLTSATPEGASAQQDVPPPPPIPVTPGEAPSLIGDSGEFAPSFATVTAVIPVTIVNGGAPSSAAAEVEISSSGPPSQPLSPQHPSQRSAGQGDAVIDNATEKVEPQPSTQSGPDGNHELLLDLVDEDELDLTL